jgi:protein-tyrosine-phosphatase
VLFACGLNSVRSPMAAALFKHLFGHSAYVGSAGVRKGELEPFAGAAMEEIGLDIARHRPATFKELEDIGPQLRSYRHAGSGDTTRRSTSRTLALEVEYWPTADPTIVEGNREQRSMPIARSATSSCGGSGSASAPAPPATNSGAGRATDRPHFRRP